MEKPRLLFIDNLRVAMITLVIMVHLSITYGGVGNWYYSEDRAEMPSIVLLTWHNAAIQAFFMGLLFLIAAYFTPASYDRKGPTRFLKDRFLRFRTGQKGTAQDFRPRPGILSVWPQFRCDPREAKGVCS